MTSVRLQPLQTIAADLQNPHTLIVDMAGMREAWDGVWRYQVCSKGYQTGSVCDMFRIYLVTNNSRKYTFKSKACMHKALYK